MDRIVLAERSSFLVADKFGDILEGNTIGQGFYYRDTRFLSGLELKLRVPAFNQQGEEEHPPLLLNASAERTYMASIQLTNDAFVHPTGRLVPRQSISIRRERLVERVLRERINLLNYNAFPVQIKLSLYFSADFRDMFDVRGFRREARGTVFPPEVDGQAIALRYLGLDQKQRWTRLIFDQEPAVKEIIGEHLSITERADDLIDMVDPHGFADVLPPGVRVTFDLELQPGRPQSLMFTAVPIVEGDVEEEPRTESFHIAVRRLEESYEAWWENGTVVRASNAIFGEMLLRCRIDLRGLSTECVGNDTRTYRYPFAGVPWFFAPFGRDALITALETLALNPDLAVGVLRYLALKQGKTIDHWRDEEPGKILHEIRSGEMTALGEVPHNPYFGSVDSTPLFLVLFCHTMEWLDDDALYHDLLPHVDAALEWIRRYGDLDGDQLVEFLTRSPRGIRNQAWKDSNNAYQFPDGSLADPPIASIEVQGYVWDAKKRLAALFRRRGRAAQADQLEREADELRQRVIECFWMPDEQYFALGLDRDKRVIPSVTSNPGHLLWSRLLDEEYGRHVARRLMSDDLFSGWGIRTLSQLSPNFNPMSYHNGSVWPHDNAMIVAGLRNYGYDREANEVLTSIFEAARFFEYYRLPELYCGFKRGETFHSGPAEYPVSCSPQAWASASVFMFLSSMLGLEPDAANRRLIVRPNLPEWLSEVDLGNLRVGSSRVSLLVRGQKVDVLARTGEVDVVVES